MLQVPRPSKADLSNCTPRRRQQRQALPVNTAIHGPPVHPGGVPTGSCQMTCFLSRRPSHQRLRRGGLVDKARSRVGDGGLQMLAKETCFGHPHRLAQTLSACTRRSHRPQSSQQRYGQGGTARITTDCDTQVVSPLRDPSDSVEAAFPLFILLQADANAGSKSRHEFRLPDVAGAGQTVQ